MRGGRNGFTLAEVLIALALLGVVAAFAIPKVLEAQVDHQKKLIWKETLATLEDLFYTANLNEEAGHGSFNAYLTRHLNFVNSAPCVRDVRFTCFQLPN